jgi:hypothetical protein
MREWLNDGWQDRPIAPSNNTRKGVKQQIAATMVPTIPVLRSIEFFNPTPVLDVRFENIADMRLP